MGNELCVGNNEDAVAMPILEQGDQGGERKTASTVQQEIKLKLVQNRVEVSSFPVANMHVWERIRKLTKVAASQNKIWMIKHPVNIVYMNTDPKNQDDLPKGYAQVYKVKENGDFQGYFEGNITQDFQPDLKEAIYVYSNASYFIGKSVKQGIFNNQVTSLKYEGEWQNEQPEGTGTENNNKGVYQGEYHLGQKNGEGKFQWTDGVSFEGTFKKGYFHGRGHLKDPIADYSYNGDYEYGVKHGKGIETRQRQTYQGRFFKGKRYGKGKLTVYEQSNPQQIRFTYEGFFEDDLPHGKGIYTDPKKNKKVEGIWQLGQMKVLL